MFSPSPDNAVSASTTAPAPTPQVLDVLRLLALAWLLVVGLWSGPMPGATLAYPNGLLGVELLLAVILILRCWRGQGPAMRDYPFLWPCLGIIAIWGIATGLRAAFRQTPCEWLPWWQVGEPMVRGLLLFLAVAGERRLLSFVWGCLLLGISLLTGATVAQHWTQTMRWYADPNIGWASGLARIPGPRAQGLTSYINLTSAMLAASLPAWWFACVRTRHRVQHGLLAAGGALTAAAVWYTGSRGPVLAVMLVALLLACPSTPWCISTLLGIAAFLLAVWFGIPWWALIVCILGIVLTCLAMHRRIRVLVPMALALCLAGGFQALDAYVLHLPLAWRVAQQGVGDNARLLLYRTAVEAINVSPWIGIGEEQYRQYLKTYPNPVIRGIWDIQRNAHNQPLHWMATQGVPAGIATVMLIMWVPWWIAAEVRRCRDTGVRAFGLAMVGGLSILLITNLAEAHFWRIEGGGCFWTLAALAAAFLHRSATAETSPATTGHYDAQHDNTIS